MAAAVVLAGGHKNALEAEGPKGAYNEALLKIGDKYMIEYVVQALRGSAYVQRIIVAGEATLQAVFSGMTEVTTVPGGETVIASFKNALAELRDFAGKLLIVTGDLPLLTVEAVDHFMASASEREGELFYPVVAKELNDERYPGVQRTYVNLSDGIYTGGNLFLADPGIIERALPAAEKLVAYRKKPVKLASCIGWGVLARYLMGWLSLAQVEEAVSRMMGVRGRVIVSPYPEVGIDVDKVSDLSLARRMLCS